MESTSLTLFQISKFKLLRVLSLSQCSDIEELPDSLSNRKHLRSFELSNTCIEKLPEPTRSLYNLQILKLVNCTHLKELPSTLHKLVNLRVLSLSHCFGLTEVPNSVDDLKQLLSLDLSQTGIKKLPDSTCLISNLQILKLNKLSIVGGAALEFAWTHQFASPWICINRGGSSQIHFISSNWGLLSFAQTALPETRRPRMAKDCWSHSRPADIVTLIFKKLISALCVRRRRVVYYWIKYFTSKSCL